MPFLSMMEAAFGQSFGEVRAYTDAPAQTANQALGTEGYMMGEQVAFGSASPSKDVVAHELVQTAGGSGGAVDAETDAHAAAEAVLSGAPVQVLARAPYGSLMLWDSYEHKAFGNLAVIKADGPPRARPRRPALPRDSADKNHFPLAPPPPPPLRLPLRCPAPPQDGLPMPKPRHPHTSQRGHPPTDSPPTPPGPPPASGPRPPAVPGPPANGHRKDLGRGRTPPFTATPQESRAHGPLANAHSPPRSAASAGRNTLSLTSAKGAAHGRAQPYLSGSTVTAATTDARNLTQAPRRRPLGTVPVARPPAGAANNSGDTYGVVYLDQDANIPLGRSEVMP
ncbi:MAG: DUF4157 domain-containing protein [Deltaproteobacteria bacterium]|nr:DUF4157 domain-containing protein [Deltaproteobacteria bacterium]